MKNEVLRKCMKALFERLIMKEIELAVAWSYVRKALQIAKTVLRWRTHGKLKKKHAPQKRLDFYRKWTTKEVFSQEKSF